MYTVYVIQDKIGRKYTGYTGNMIKRLWEHNNKITVSTRKGSGWKIAYFEKLEDKKDAIKREKFLKTGKGRDFLKQHLGVV